MRSTAGGAVSSWIVVWSMPNHAWRTSWSSRSSRSLSPTSTTTTWALIASRPDVSVHTCRSCTRRTPGTRRMAASISPRSRGIGVPSSRTLTSCPRSPPSRGTMMRAQHRPGDVVQPGRVDERPDALSALVPVGLRGGRRAAGDPDGEERERGPADVGQHVARGREEREASRPEGAQHLDDEERGREPERRHEPVARARGGSGPVQVGHHADRSRFLLQFGIHHDRSLALHGQRFHYTEWGDPTAPAVVLLHGITGHARTWDDEARALAARSRVLALDQRGHGDSDPAPDGDYTVTTMAADLAAFADALRLRHFSVVGLSMGGRVAIAFAGSQPERVERLIVVDIGPDIAPGGRLRVGAMMAQTPERFDDLGTASAWARTANPRYTDTMLRHRVVHGTRPVDGGLVWKYDRAIRDAVRSGRWRDPADLL